jgi:hypothetical protein
MSRQQALVEAAAIIARSVPDIRHLASLLEDAGLRRLAEVLLDRRPAEVGGAPQLARAEVLAMWRTGKMR